MTSDDTEYARAVSGLKKYKVAFVLLLIGVMGAGCVVVAELLDSDVWVLPGMLPAVPWLAIGEAMISAAIIGGVYEWFVRGESDKSLTLKMNDLFSTQNEAIERTIVREYYGATETLSRLAPAEREEAVKHAVRAWFGNPTIGNEVERVVLPQLRSAQDYWKDVRFEVELGADSGGTSFSDDYFQVILDCEYEGVVRSEVFVASLDSEAVTPYSLVDSWPTKVDFAWTLGRMIHYDWLDEDVAIYRSIQIDDRELELTRVEVADGSSTRLETRGTGPFMRNLVGTRVRHRIELLFKAPKRGHYFSFPLIRTTVGWRCLIRGSLAELGFKRVFLIPFLQSGGGVAPQVAVRGSAFTCSVGTPRCVFAGSGAVFAWNLATEYADQDEPAV